MLLFFKKSVFARTFTKLGQALLFSSIALLIVTGIAMAPVALLSPVLMIPVVATLALIALGMSIAGGNIRLGADLEVSSEAVAVKGMHNRMFILFNNLNKDEHYSESERLLSHAMS